MNPKIVFDLTLDDYREATAGHHMRGGRRWASRLGWSLFAMVLVAIFLLMIAPQLPDEEGSGVAAGRSNSAIVEFLLPLLPWVLIFVVIWILVFRTIRRSRPTSELYEHGHGWPETERYRKLQNPHTPLAIAVGAVVVVILLSSVVRTVRESIAAADGPVALPQVMFSTMLPLLPWVIIGVFVWFVVRRHGGLIQTMWLRQPHTDRTHLVKGGLLPKS